MIGFINKVRSYGVRRAVVLGIVLSISRVRCYLYRVVFSDNVPSVDGKVLQATQFLGKGKITIDNAQLGVWPSPALLSGVGYIEARGVDAKVQIGHSTFINNNFTLIADKTGITIGKRCLIGPDCFITDSDFHGLTLSDRKSGNYQCEPVIIGDDVFIGAGVKILKGAQIGEGAVIGSGSVVVSSILPHAIYAGVPAKLIRKL